MTPPSVLQWLDAFESEGNGAAEKSVELVRMLLEHSPEPFSRYQYSPGHITATACVQHPSDQSFLLIYHKRLGRWLMPGGHVEPQDDDVAQAAAREAIEETGIVLGDVAPCLVSVDVHAIPPKNVEPMHLHHDLTFRFRALTDVVAVTEETEGVVWATAQDFGKYRLAANLRQAAARSLALLNGC